LIPQCEISWHDLSVTPAPRTTARPGQQRLRAVARPGGRDWYKITNTGVGPATLYLYDEIGWIGITAADLVRDLAALDVAEIDVRLSSPGGEVFEGFTIYEALRSHRARITVYVDSLAASIASVIAMAGDRIVMGPYAEMMIHDAMAVCAGNADDMRLMIEDLERESERIASVYAGRAGGTPLQWRKAMKAETWYSAKEAVAAGLADEVASPTRVEEPDDAPAMAASWDLSIFRFPGRDKAPAPELVARADGAAPEAPPADPTPAPDPAPPVDPAAFRDAAVAALDPVPDFDPASFRSLMAAVAVDAPAPPEPDRSGADPTPAPVPPADPEPPAPAHEVMADYFRTVMSQVAHDAPAPPEPTRPDPGPDPEPGFTIDRAGFKTALREATL
jgi:ATP-dependent protease ClpP protease subunit